MNLKKISITFIIFLFSLKPLFCQKQITEQPTIEETPKTKLLEEQIFNMPISLDLRNIDVIDALKFLASKSGLNIVPTRNVTGRVILTVENVPFKDVFDVILRSNSLAYTKIGDIYYIMSEAEYRAQYGKNFFDTRKVKVFRLKYAIPEQAFNLLDALKSEIGRVLVDKESGNVLVLDTEDKITQMEDILAEFEKKNLVKIFSLKYAKAKEVEDILKSQLEAKGLGFVKADERNNQIIVQTLQERMKEVEDLIALLDRQTKEVLIDAKIVKIKLSDQLDTGVEWEGIFGISKAFGTTYIGSYPFSYITAGITNPTFQTRQDTYNSLGQITSYPFSGTTSSLSGSTKKTIGEKIHLGLFNSDRDFDTLINFLNTIGKTKVLANPKIVVVNNQEAKLHIGEKQAYVTSTTTTGQTTSTISEEVNFIDVGIQLSVTPIINDDGYITMKIRPEVSSVSSILTTPTGNKIPIVDTSTTETTVMMKDATTLLIGGLRKDEKTVSSQETPLLGKVPFLGFLFRTRTDKTERSELLIMITPHIISGDKIEVAEKLPKDYQEYKDITEDKTVPFQANADKQIKPKLTYKDYTTNPNF
ncbi:MAG: hypothetical protein NC925_03075 [Candidatus Omnitrophica bacterium]|nr:hypothetical protein [Candidatus Omnitrophota bacterium]